MQSDESVGSQVQGFDLQRFGSHSANVCVHHLPDLTGDRAVWKYLFEIQITVYVFEIPSTEAFQQSLNKRRGRGRVRKIGRRWFLV